MNQQIDNTQTFCVAWFKLAELITRREKEKALSLYRLLAHSFEDKAYVLQLEADILWALEDKQALDKYTQAAFLYKKEEKLISAIAIYYHLLTMQPQNLEILSKLIFLSFSLFSSERFEQSCKILLHNLDNGNITQEQFFDICKRLADSSLTPEKLNQEKLDQKKLKWIDKFLLSALKKKYLRLQDRIKKYYSELNLNFNS